MIWKFITFLVRILDPEKAHNITLLALKYGLHPRLQKIKIKTKIKNLEFTNPLGIAAGFDKNAEVIKAIHSDHHMLGLMISFAGVVSMFGGLPDNA